MLFLAKIEFIDNLKPEKIMRIATFNINSINARLPQFIKWLQNKAPDIVMLQEIKCEHNSFPFFEINAVGYNAKVLGQKSYNGVAVLSRYKIETVCEGLPDFADDAARYLEVAIKASNAEITAASVYLPNGNPPYNNPDDDSRFAYKLAFMDALYKHAIRLRQEHKNVVLGGDFNVILTPDDVYNPELFVNNALYRPEVQKRLRALKYLGFYDAFRTLYPAQNGYTFWDYGGKAYEQDLGMRIDYQFLAPSLADRLKSVAVDKSLRMAEKPSDHTPLITEFDL